MKANDECDKNMTKNKSTTLLGALMGTAATVPN